MHIYVAIFYLNTLMKQIIILAGMEINIFSLTLKTVNYLKNKSGCSNCNCGASVQ